MNSVGPLQKGHGSIIKRRERIIKKVLIKPSPSVMSPHATAPALKPSSGKPVLKNGSFTNGRSHGTSLKVPSRLQKQRSETPQRARFEKRKRASPAQIPLESNSEGSSSDGDILEARKRPKNSVSAEPDVTRRVRSVRAFDEERRGTFDMIHAEIIASAKSAKYEPALGEGPGQPQLLLQYPSASQVERYDLVRPRDKDDFKPIDDIVRVIELVSKHYVPSDQVSIFTDETTGILRKLQRAQNWREAEAFRKTVSDYNEVITKLRKNGTIAKTLDSVHSLGLPHVEAILTQVYARTVSLQVEKLRHYDNGTDNVYGELLPRFVSRILKQTKLKSSQVFVDMGSGVGNVVLQAALEVGCESWGCEMMEAPCEMANLQREEFKARCRLWGLAPGEVHLEKGDFIESPAIQNVLKRADVLLINNQAFLPQLNEKLVRKFLDLKEGCQVVSLKPFEQITKRNYGSIMNQFKVDVKEYFSGNVSWTDAPGTYYIHTKDSSRVKEFPTEVE